MHQPGYGLNALFHIDRIKRFCVLHTLEKNEAHKLYINAKALALPNIRQAEKEDCWYIAPCTSTAIHRFFTDSFVIYGALSMVLRGDSSFYIARIPLHSTSIIAGINIPLSKPFRLAV